MATDLVIRILSKDQTEAGLKKTEKNLDKILTTVGAVTGAVVAFGFAAKKAFEIGEEGAELQLTEKRFDRLSKTIGTTAAILKRDLQVAMGGIVSQTEAMALGTDLLSLGLVKSTEEATRMAAVVGQLGMDMNQLVLTLTNQTTMRFDALGVSVDGFKEKVKELEDSGKSANEAFKLAFLAQAEDQVEKVGDVAKTSAGEFKQMRAAWKDWIDDIKKGVADVLVPSITVANDRRDAFKAVEEAVRAKMITEEEGFGLNARIANSETDLIRLTEQLTDELEAYRQVITETSPEVQRLVDLEDAHVRSLVLIAEASEDAKEETGKFLDTIDRNIASPVTNLIKDLEWLQATGGGPEKAFELLKAAAEKAAGAGDTDGVGAIIGKSRELDMAILDVQGKMENLYPNEIAQNIQRDLGIPFSEAKAFVTGTGSLEEALSRLSETQWQIDIVYNVTTKGRAPSGAPGVPSFPDVLSGSQGIGHAAGGPLGPINLVGERGAEMIINGIVVDAQTTKTLMKLGLFPNQSFGFGGAIGAFEGDIIGGGRRTTSGRPGRTTGIGGGGRATTVSVGAGVGVGAGAGAAVMAPETNTVVAAISPMVASIQAGEQAKAGRDNDLLAAVQELAKAEDMEQAVKNAGDLRVG